MGPLSLRATVGTIPRAGTDPFVYAIASLLVIVAVSLVVTRVATVMLTATGLSREVARFQARSAFTGSGFTTSESADAARQLALVWISRSQVVETRLNALISAGLRRFTDVETRDHAVLVALAGDYGVSELVVEDGDWAAGRTLGELALRDEGIAVLGLTRGDRYLGTPNGDTRVEPGDVLVLYGRDDDVAELDCRPAGPEGDRRHEDAVARRFTAA